MDAYAGALIKAHPYLTFGSLACAFGAAAVLVWYLLAKPPFTGQVKVLLLLSLGLLPIGSALTANVAGFSQTTHRAFCGSCHVMTPYTADSSDPASTTLAAIHARNEEFGADNCYECHRDYGAFSTIMTKWGGMKHVYAYYTEYHRLTLEEARYSIELYKPFANAACMRCHSTLTPMWKAVGDHRGLADRVRTGEVSCASTGCHGPAHPFSKRDAESHAALGAPPAPPSASRTPVQP